MTRIARYCTCGGTLTGRVSPDHWATYLNDAWNQTHNSDGCGPATPAQAAAARRRSERGDSEITRT